MARTVQRMMLPGCILLAVIYVYWIPHLGATLPAHYHIAHWPLTWVGLDGLELLFVLLTGWFILRESRLCVITASMLASLLLADAWFDNLTAHGADVLGARFGLIPELGVAAVCVTFAATYKPFEERIAEFGA